MSVNKIKQRGKKLNKVSEGRAHLEGMKRLDNLIHALKEQIEIETDMLTDTSVHYKDMMVQTSGVKDQIGEKVPEIADIRMELEEYLRRLQKRKALTLTLIKEMDIDHQELIMLYYMQNKTLEVAAEEMHRSYKWTWIHLQEAVHAFEYLYLEWLSNNQDIN